MTKKTETKRSLQTALHQGRLARSQAFHDGLSAIATWITGGKPGGSR